MAVAPSLRVPPPALRQSAGSGAECPGSLEAALVQTLTPILQPLTPPGTLELHKRPESGEGPTKLGVVTVPASVGTSRGDLTTSMDGLAVEVRGSNGAFYKVRWSRAQRLARRLKVDFPNKVCGSCVLLATA